MGCTALQITISVMHSLSAISLIPFIYLYINAYIKGNLKSPEHIFYAGVLLFGLIFISFIFVSIPQGDNDKGFYAAKPYIADQLYVAQNSVFVGIFFLRLYTMFQGTSFVLNEGTIVFFIACYIIVLIFGSLAAIGWSKKEGAFALFASLGIIFYLLLLIFIIGLFIYKLIKVHKNAAKENIVVCDNHDNEKNDNLVYVINKTSLLCFISSSTIIWRLISFAVNPIFASSPNASCVYHFIFNVILIAELYTNFMCIFLSFKYFNGYYQTLCGCCHSCCYESWIKRCTDHNDQQEKHQKMMKQIELSCKVCVDKESSQKYHE